MRFFLFLLFSSLFLLPACSVEKQRLSRIKREAIPNDVKASDYILLVAKPVPPSVNSQTRQINKYMQQYPGKWEMVSEEQLKEPKYADVNKYRYYLKPNTSVLLESTVQANGQFAPVHTSRYYDANYVFVDRKGEKEYPPTGLVLTDYSWPIKYIAIYLRDM